VLLSEKTFQALNSITGHLEISVSEFIRKLVEEKIKQSNSKDYNSKGEN
jgi:hypothetical protein